MESKLTKVFTNINNVTNDIAKEWKQKKTGEDLALQYAQKWIEKLGNKDLAVTLAAMLRYRNKTCPKSDLVKMKNLAINQYRNDKTNFDNLTGVIQCCYITAALEKKSII